MSTPPAPSHILTRLILMSAIMVALVSTVAIWPDPAANTHDIKSLELTPVSATSVPGSGQNTTSVGGSGQNTTSVGGSGQNVTSAETIQYNVKEPSPSFCPSMCLCHVSSTTGHVITCINQSLTAVPQNLPATVTHLDLHGNQIVTIANVFQNLTNVQRIDLSFNMLNSIDAKDFQSNLNLRYLNLYANNITRINANTFQYLHNLESLNIAGNSIVQTDGAMFFGLLNLVSLNASANRISDLSEDTFRFLDKLQRLDLSSNTIRELSKDTFQNLQMLDTLNIEHNDLQELDGLYFSEDNHIQYLNLSANRLTELANMTRMTGLLTLDLSWNNLTNLSAEWFDPLVNVTYLSLDGNPVVSIQISAFRSMISLQTLSLSSMPNLGYLFRNTFDGLQNLQVLRLCHNPNLSFIHKQLFTPLPSVSIIDVSYNNISSVYTESLLSNTQLMDLDVRGNPLFCDCSIEWLLNASSITNHLTDLDCVTHDSNQTVSLLQLDLDSLHCSEVAIVSQSADSQVKIGSSTILKCEVESFPRAEITWITPRKRILTYHNYHQFAKLDYLPLSDKEKHNEYHASHEWHDQTSYYSESESRSDRIIVLEDGSLYLDYVMRSDAGPYKCIAKNPRNSSETVIHLYLDYNIITQVKIWSIIVGAGCAGSFFLLNLTYSLTLAAIRRCISQRRRERIRQIIESMDQYKSAHLARIKENYNHQVGRIRDQYHYRLGQLREHHQSQVGRMGRMREGASQKVERIRENYNNQIGKLKDYSSNQLVQIREKYNNQIYKIKDYGSEKFDKIHEKYKLKQQHVINLLEMMNLDNCRTVFESECVRTESMILQSDIFMTDVPNIHSPIDSVSNSDSEYLTATSTESSKHTSLENLQNAMLEESCYEIAHSLHPYLPDDDAETDASTTSTTTPDTPDTRGDISMINEASDPLVTIPINTHKKRSSKRRSRTHAGKRGQLPLVSQTVPSPGEGTMLEDDPGVPVYLSGCGGGTNDGVSASGVTKPQSITSDTLESNSDVLESHGDILESRVNMVQLTSTPVSGTPEHHSNVFVDDSLGTCAPSSHEAGDKQDIFVMSDTTPASVRESVV